MRASKPIHRVFPKKAIFGEFTLNSVKSPARKMAERERKARLDKLIANSTGTGPTKDRNVAMFREYFGFDGGRAGNYSHLARKYGLERDRTRQIIGNMIRRMQIINGETIARMYGINRKATLERTIKEKLASR